MKTIEFTDPPALSNSERWVKSVALRGGAVKDRAGYLLQDQRQATLGHAKEKAESEAEDEPPFVGPDVAVEPSVWLPGDADRLPK